MKSQADHLRETIAYVEAKHGPDGLILQHLKVQLASLEKQAERKRTFHYDPSPVTL